MLTLGMMFDWKPADRGRLVTLARPGDQDIREYFIGKGSEDCDEIIEEIQLGTRGTSLKPHKTYCVIRRELRGIYGKNGPYLRGETIRNCQNHCDMYKIDWHYRSMEFFYKVLTGYVVMLLWMHK
jgi:hypothetical protein